MCTRLLSPLPQEPGYEATCLLVVVGHVVQETEDHSCRQLKGDGLVEETDRFFMLGVTFMDRNLSRSRMAYMRERLTFRCVKVFRRRTTRLYVILCGLIPGPKEPTDNNPFF